MLFLQLPRVHSPSTARPPDPDIRSRSSISSLLPCYFCSSRPSTAPPPPVHRILTFDLAPPSLASSHAISAAPARPQPVHRILTFDLAPPSLASSHAISAAPARPQPVHRPSTARPPHVHSPSTARPQPVHRILTFCLAPHDAFGKKKGAEINQVLSALFFLLHNQHNIQLKLKRTQTKMLFSVTH